MLDNSARIDLTCLNCGHKWDERLGDLRKGPVSCSECNTEVDTAPFAKGMDSAEDALKRFGRGLK